MKNNFFEIFGLPQTFLIDSGALAERYRQLQKEFHPDRYARKSEAERNLAVRWAATINQAFDTLKSPLKRAEYLLSQQGVEGDASIGNDVNFLMRQLALRERLSEVRDESDPFVELAELRRESLREYDTLQALFSEQYSSQQFQDGLSTVARMQFFSKLFQEMDLLEEELEDRLPGGGSG